MTTIQITPTSSTQPLVGFWPMPLALNSRNPYWPATWARLAMTSTSAGEAVQAKARGELFHYFRRLVETKRTAPGSDLATVLAQATVDGKPLLDEELDAYFMVLTAAGNETTRYLISGGLEQLCLQPDDLALLVKAPEATPAAIEELTRWVSPVMMMRRTATTGRGMAGFWPIAPPV